MFYSTQDAIKQGIKAREKQKLFWNGLRSRFYVLSQDAMQKNKYDLGMMFAVQAQFCREAISADELTLQIKKIF